MPRTLHFRATNYPAGLRQDAHLHDHAQISLVLSGTLRESVRDRDVTAGALSVVVKDAGVRHANAFGNTRVTIAQLALRTGCLGQLMEPDAPRHAWSWSHDTTIAQRFVRIVQRAASGTQRFAEDDVDVVDLLACITARALVRPSGAPPRWLSDAAEELRASWRTGLRVRDVALAAGVHPVYLARCYRRWYGHSVSDALRFLRHRAAMSAMINDSGTLSGIAHAAGYADESHFNRDVRSWSGLSPGQLRRLMVRLTIGENRANVVAPVQV